MVGHSVRGYLEAYAGAADLQARALDDLLRLSAGATWRSGTATWTRDALHDRDDRSGRDDEPAKA